METKGDLIARLRGCYSIHVNDGAGPLNGSTTFTRKFDVPPINIEAANEIERLRDNLAADSGICQAHRDLMKPQDGCGWCQFVKLHSLAEERLSIIKAIGAEKDELAARASAAEHRRNAAEHRAQRIVLDAELKTRAENAERHLDWALANLSVYVRAKQTPEFYVRFEQALKASGSTATMRGLLGGGTP